MITFFFKDKILLFVNIVKFHISILDTLVSFFIECKWNDIEYFELSGLYVFRFVIHKVKGDIVSFVLSWS